MMNNAELSVLKQQLLGRARYLRDKGEVKTPELLERAAAALVGADTVPPVARTPPKGAVKLNHTPVTHSGHQCEIDGDVDHFGRVVYCDVATGQWWAYYPEANQPFFPEEKEEGCFKAVLGVFGVPSASGTIYNITKEQLKEQLDSRLNKTVGEINPFKGTEPLLENGSTAFMRARYGAVNEAQAVGGLIGYSIEDIPGGGFRVVGEVRPTPMMASFNDPSPKFAIRTMVTPGPRDSKIVDVDRIISFDYVRR